MMDVEEPITKDAVVSKVVTYISDSLGPTEDSGYMKTLWHVFQAAWPDDDARQAFKKKVDEWTTHLGMSGHDHILTVPSGSLKEFHIAPWQLSYDPSTSVKGCGSTLSRCTH